MADLAYSRLRANLFNLSVEPVEAHEECDNRPTFVSAMQDAWSIIDSVHRLRGLLKQTPGLKQNVPALQIFYRNTANIGDLRNGVQHLNSEIDKLVSLDLPVWGSISWAAQRDPNEPLELYVGALIAGTVFEGGGSEFVNPLGKVFHPPIDHITLIAFGRSVTLSHVLAQVERMTQSLEEALREAVKQLPSDATGHPGSDLGW
jgi:hypothetical protein